MRSRTPWGARPFPWCEKVYGWLSWATSVTTRGLRNRLFDAVLLRRDGGNREVPSGGWVAQEDHERVLRAVIQAGWPDREPKWPAFVEGGGGAARHGRGGEQLAPPGPAHHPHPLALPPEEPAAAAAPGPHTSGGAGDGRARLLWSWAAGTGGWQRTRGAGDPPAGPGPTTQSAPPRPPRRSHSMRTRAAPGRGEDGSHEHADARDAGTPLTRGPLTTNS